MFWQNYFIRFQKAEQLFAANISNFKSNYLIVKEDVNNPMHQQFTSYEMNFMLKKITGHEKFMTMEFNSNWKSKPDSFLKITTPYRKVFMYHEFDNKIDSPTIITLKSAPDAMLNAEKQVWQYWMSNSNAEKYPMKLTFTNFTNQIIHKTY
jgi:hypothetical protein